jgi:pilus assembly protein CpaC
MRKHVSRLVPFLTGIGLLLQPSRGFPVELPAEMLLVVGEQRVLDAEDIASFSESTTGVIEVKIPRSGRQLVLTAIRPGDTSLLLIGQDGNQRHLPITVFARHPDTIIDEISHLIDLPGMTWRRVGPRVFLDGTVGSEAELARIEQIRHLYAGQVVSLVQRGDSVRPRTNIRLDLLFMETSASRSQEGGVNWPDALGATGGVTMSYDLMTGTGTASYRILNQAMPSISAAEASGKVRIRKRAYLVTTSGHTARYSSGGEVNVKIAGSQAAELRTVPYGCILQVRPILDVAAGRIDLEIDAEVAELRENRQEAPGRTLSQVKTLVHLGLGQSIVLSGLDSHGESLTRSGIPFLSRIPVLGILFGVHRRRTEQVTGLIAITPVVLDHPDRDARRSIDEALERFMRWKGIQKPEPGGFMEAPGS